MLVVSGGSVELRGSDLCDQMGRELFWRHTAVTNGIVLWQHASNRFPIFLKRAYEL